MRLNRYVASGTNLSRRAADVAIAAGRVAVNGRTATVGVEIGEDDQVMLDGKVVTPQASQYYLFHKPAGYICSRAEQGEAPTIYGLIPPELHYLNPVGRLDKDSSGLLLLTNDGDFANELTHPSKLKLKRYVVSIKTPLTDSDTKKIERGVQLEDGKSAMQLKGAGKHWEVTIHEGRNRQIRRTFAVLGYTVAKLHRTSFGPYKLGTLKSGEVQMTEPK